MIEIPAPCFANTLLDTLLSAGVLYGGSKNIQLHVNTNTYISPSSIAFLAAWGEEMHREGIRCQFQGDRGVLDYLARMNLFRCIHCEYEENFNRTAAAGRFIPLLRVETPEDVEKAYERVCDLIVCQFDNARAFLPAVDWAVYEILDNVIAHSEANGCAYICGQYMPTKDKICIAIYDKGKGLLNSLRSSYVLNSHKDAIKHALKRGVTSRQGDHLGNGLAGTKDICSLNGARFSIWSGDSLYVETSGKEFYSVIPNTTGTGIILDLYTNKPVDLRHTFIENNETDYIYRQVIRMEDGGGMVISDECSDLGSRATAKRVRRKIEAILPDMDDPLVLNFDTINTLSSSFADELIGKLFVKLGNDFNKNISIANMSEPVSRRINTVIEQRIKGVYSCPSIKPPKP